MKPIHPAIQGLDLVRLLDAMREGIQVIDRDWKYVYMNAAAAAHGRRPAPELLGRSMSECYPGIEETPVFRALERCMVEREPVALLNEFAYSDGAARSFELRIHPCEIGIVVLSIDVTEGRKTEEQLRHAQKMEAIGRLAGGVAHDFNNLLSVILSSSIMALEDLNPLDPLRTDLEAVRRAGEKAAELTKQLLVFSRRQVLVPQILNLNEVIRELERMLRRLLGEDIELVVHYERNLALVTVDPGQIDQVIMNLAVNARDAMPDGGQLTVETANVELDAAYAADHADAQPGPHVMLAVSDTGMGMDKDVQSHIFEPFFTTKDVSKGTGLGLSTVYGIVKQSGGNIWVYSEKNRGTTFKVYLPISRTNQSSFVPSVEPATLHGTETILVVEDQDEVRAVTTQVLRRFGYRVIEARDGGEALVICERLERPIDMLITDVVMPHMNGRELVARLKDQCADLEVLFVSGYPENAVVEHGILEAGIEYLQKPIVPETLARRVRQILDGASIRARDSS